MGERRIVAMGGGGFQMEPDNPLLDRFILGLVRKRKPRVCFIATATGDNDNVLTHFYRAFSGRAEPCHLPLFDRSIRDLAAFACAQDVIYVGGGNTANMLAVWRVQGMDKALAKAWRAGVLMCGVSAGAMCWFQGGVTDSFAMPFHPLHDGLGFLPGAFCPHFDGEPRRRAVLHRELARGLPATIACDDGAAVFFRGRKLIEAVSSRRNARAYRVSLRNGEVVESEIPTRYLGS